MQDSPTLVYHLSALLIFYDASKDPGLLPTIQQMPKFRQPFSSSA
jgi:hypothetical protein